MLEQLQKDLRSFEADVRWIATPAIHLTLKFLGDADPAIIPRLTDAFRVASEFEPALKLRLHGLGFFPDSKSPRILWCGVGGDTDALLRIQQKVEAACNSLGFPAENRRFHPHLTLGRVKGKRNLQPLVDCIKIGSDFECNFSAGCYNIYRSTLKPQGATYTVMETIRLIGQKDNKERGYPS